MNSFKELRNFYSRPRFFYYLPLIGFVAYMLKVMKLARECGLTDYTTPGGKILKAFTTKFFIVLNVFFPLYMAIVIFVFNFSLIVFKRSSLAALDVNEKLTAKVEEEQKV